MHNNPRRARLLTIIAVTTLLAAQSTGQSAAAQSASQRKEFKYTVGAGAGVNIVNEFGAITIKASPGRQVVITGTPRSDKVEVDCSQSGNRIEVHSHVLQSSSPSDNTVDYEISVPADANVTLRSGTGPVRIEKLGGDVSVQGETAQVDVQNLSGTHLHIRTVSGPITLNNVSNGHVDATSIGGNVTLTNVSGPKIAVSSTKGNIRYDGDAGGGGEYQFINNSGDIDVILPADASVDITARTVNGTVQNDFPLQQKTHTSFALDSRSVAGVSLSGASMIHLSSFSGKIRVKKR